VLTPEMRFISESTEERVQCYRVLDNDGQLIMCSNFKKVFHLYLFSYPNEIILFLLFSVKINPTQKTFMC
jgi:hypothetical protein